MMKVENIIYYKIYSTVLISSKARIMLIVNSFYEKQGKKSINNNIPPKNKKEGRENPAPLPPPLLNPVK